MGKLPFEEIEREILVKRETKIDVKHGCEPDKRKTEELINYGIFCLNKPSGPSSHQVVDYVKEILNLDKSGHSGTLDPMVTGVLPIALGKATKITQALLPAGKEYVALMILHKPIDINDIKKTFNELTGKITQLPPKRSAVKRQLRERNVYYVEILEIEGQDILFRIGCQAGTYIRKYTHDFGLKLGVGAHMQQLVRTKAGPFSDNEMYSLQDLKDAYDDYKEGNEENLRKIIKPIEYAVSHLPKIWVHNNVIGNLCHGASLNAPGISKLESGINKNELVAVMSLKNELVCLGIAEMDSEEMLNAKKGKVIKTSRVFMERGIYPKFEK